MGFLIWANYVRLKNLELGYNLPASLVQKAKLGILWNRDIESIEILLNQLKEDKKNQIINIEEKEIFDLLESALFENRPEFVDLLIENFIS